MSCYNVWLGYCKTKQDIDNEIKQMSVMRDKIKVLNIIGNPPKHIQESDPLIYHGFNQEQKDYGDNDNGYNEQSGQDELFHKGPIPSLLLDYFLKQLTNHHISVSFYQLNKIRYLDQAPIQIWAKQIHKKTFMCAWFELLFSFYLENFESMPLECLIYLPPQLQQEQQGQEQQQWSEKVGQEPFIKFSSRVYPWDNIMLEFSNFELDQSDNTATIMIQSLLQGIQAALAMPIDNLQFTNSILSVETFESFLQLQSQQEQYQLSELDTTGTTTAAADTTSSKNMQKQQCDVIPKVHFLHCALLLLKEQCKQQTKESIPTTQVCLEDKKKENQNIFSFQSMANINYCEFRNFHITISYAMIISKMVQQVLANNGRGSIENLYFDSCKISVDAMLSLPLPILYSISNNGDCTTGITNNYGNVAKVHLNCVEFYSTTSCILFPQVNEVEWKDGGKTIQILGNQGFISYTPNEEVCVNVQVLLTLMSEFEPFTKVTHFHFGSCQFGGSDRGTIMCEIAKQLNQTNILYLDLSDTDITNTEILTLAGALRNNTTLTHLDISGNSGITSQGLACLVEMLRMHNFTIIDLMVDWFNDPSSIDFFQQIQYYTSLNRFGRHTLSQVELLFPPGLIPRIISKASQENLSLLYYMIQACPNIVTRIDKI